MTVYGFKPAFGLACLLLLILVLAACAGPRQDLDHILEGEKRKPSRRELGILTDMAEVYLEEASCVRSAHAFEAVIEADPQRLEARLGLAAAQWCREDYAEARKTLEDAREQAGLDSARYLNSFTALLEIIAAKRNASKALKLESVLPPPVPDSVAVLPPVDTAGETGPGCLALARLLNLAVKDSGLGLGSPGMVRELADRLGPDKGLPRASAARRIARLTGSSHAVLCEYKTGSVIHMTVLPVMPENARTREIQSRIRTVREKKAEGLERLTELQRRAGAVARGLEYFRNKERLSGLISERDALCERISMLMSTGRVEEYRNALQKLEVLENKITALSSKNKNFKHELFELKLNVYGISAQYLKEEAPRVQMKILEVAESLEKLQQVEKDSIRRLENLIPDEGLSLDIPAPCSPLDLWRKRAASLIAGIIRGQNLESDQHFASCAMGLDPEDSSRLDSLGSGLAALEYRKFDRARGFFENCQELSPENMPPPGAKPDEIAEMPPERAAIWAYMNLLENVTDGK